MSTLQVETIKNPTSLNTVNSEQVIQGAANALVNFNGNGAISINNSYNVSSVTDVGVGYYTINFVSPLNNVYYTINAMLNVTNATSTARTIHEDTVISRTSSQITVHCGYVNSTNNYSKIDHGRISIVIHGGL